MTKPTYHAIDKLKRALIALDLPTTVDLANLHDLADEARQDYDDKSETWQESEKGEEEITRIDQLDGVIAFLDTAAESCKDALDTINDIEADAPEGAFAK